jgi:hypothetical protein
MGTSSVIAIAVAAASLALHAEPLVWLIGPAGCLILIPALVTVCALPWWQYPTRRLPVSGEVLPVAHTESLPGKPAAEMSPRLREIELYEEARPDGTRRRRVVLRLTPPSRDSDSPDVPQEHQGAFTRHAGLRRTGGGPQSRPRHSKNFTQFLE